MANARVTVIEVRKYAAYIWTIIFGRRIMDDFNCTNRQCVIGFDFSMDNNTHRKQTSDDKLLSHCVCGQLSCTLLLRLISIIRITFNLNLTDMLVTSRFWQNQVWSFRIAVHVRLHFYRHRFVAHFICGWNFRRSVMTNDGHSLFQLLIRLKLTRSIQFRIRGKLGSMALLIRSIGYMVAFIVGAYIEYSIVPFVYLGIPIVFFAFVLYLPNTAPYLMRTGKCEVSFHLIWPNIGVCDIIIHFSIFRSTGSKRINKIL